MKMNKFQKKLNELFNERINQGLIVSAGRQLGKTCFIINKVKKLAENGYTVNIFVHSSYIKKLYTCRLEHQNIRISVGFNKKHLRFKKPDYVFIDEPRLFVESINLEPKPNWFIIGTYLNDIITFDDSWYDNKIKEKFKTKNKEMYEKEFMGGVIKNETRTIH